MAKSGGSFKPGQSGNPGGRTKKNVELERLIQVALEDTGPNSASGNKAIDRLVKIMEEPKSRDAVPAAKLLMAYAYGAPKQQISIDANVTHEEWQENIAAFRASRASTGKRSKKT